MSSPSSRLISVNNYIESLQNTLKVVRKIAHDNLKVSQTNMKAHFHQKAEVREFNEGDLVLACIPVPGSPLQAKFHGPYKVKEWLNQVNYLIKTPDRRKATQHIHVNLLKPFIPRTTTESDSETARPSLSLSVSMPVSMSESVPGSDAVIPSRPVATNNIAESKIIAPLKSKENSYILSHLDIYLAHLQPQLIGKIIKLLKDNIEVFSDHPGRYIMLLHDVNLVPGTSPFRTSPYRMHPQKREQMRREVDYLLEQGLAIPSHSPWASPTDYRRVNAVTVPDAYPLPRVDDLIDEVWTSPVHNKEAITKSPSQKKLSSYRPFRLHLACMNTL